MPPAQILRRGGEMMSKNKSQKNVKANISSQNPDTGIPVFVEDDSRPYEQKNMPKGAFNKSQGSK